MIPDYRAIAVTKLATLALKRTALKEALAPFETQIAAIQKACAEATAAECSAIERLEAELKQMALEHGQAIFGEARSITQGALTLGLRGTDKVEVAGEEEDVIAALQKAAKSHTDEATRLAAACCLRTKVELNKPFIRENWETFQAWFTIFGLKVVEADSASIAERKPTRPKPAKPAKKGKQPAEAEPEALAA